MIKRVLLSIAMMTVLAVGATQPVWADPEVPEATEQTAKKSGQSQICQDYKNDPDLYAAAGCDKADVTAADFVNNIFTVIISLVGVVGVGVMVFGGIMYTTSTGDAAKVQRAKHIVMYGIIGMIVALLAYAIVFFITKVVNGL